jgi:hypothetical protein
MLRQLTSFGHDVRVMLQLLRHPTLGSTLDVYAQAVTPAKHAAQAAVVSLLSSSNGTCASPFAQQDAVPIAAKGAEKGRGMRPFPALDGFDRTGLTLLEGNGGDDGTRTRGLCRDSGPLKGFTTTYKTAGTAKGRLSRSKSHKTPHSVGSVVGWKISGSSLEDVSQNPQPLDSVRVGRHTSIDCGL